MRLTFPEGFLWGTAAAAHQVEGDNRNSDWWAWELRPGSPVAEPSGTAIEQYTRYRSDADLVGSLGFNTYRFSVEWSRIEPAEGTFDEAALAHYVDVTEAVLEAGMTPMVTLNHFTLPIWLAGRGGWMAPDAPELFARYCDRLVRALGDRVDWYCTINEPGIVAYGGYLGGLDFPPGTKDEASWEAAIAGLRRGHACGLESVKESRPDARVGATHAMVEWEANEGGAPLRDYIRDRMEDTFFEVSEDDDFVGVQTYTRVQINVPNPLRPLARLLVETPAIRRLVVPPALRSQSKLGQGSSGEIRRTDMGYEWRPEAIAATVRRAAELLPGKDVIVTEHGIAATDDAERVEFIDHGLAALHAAIADGVPLIGYIHWSAFDNFEWAVGYRMQFGLIGVDRATQERTVKPSGCHLGSIARSNALEL